MPTLICPENTKETTINDTHRKNETTKENVLTTLRPEIMLSAPLPLPRYHSNRHLYVEERHGFLLFGQQRPTSATMLCRTSS
ncbi:hypothetical protein HPP92_000262 [Vanilla planifolia]|uniref:Uncharacterized protein n=1 Tax=Vanilla planifolia TaxID=51239 RepID=A0A835RVW0_VANPL|nr:hypothetical protein HPP92_000262 [Vanilla planifolia]